MNALPNRRARLAPPQHAALLALAHGVALLRTRAVDAGYWIDEGLSLGIAGAPARATSRDCWGRTARRRSTTCCSRVWTSVAARARPPRGRSRCSPPWPPSPRHSGPGGPVRRAGGVDRGSGGRHAAAAHRATRRRRACTRSSASVAARDGHLRARLRPRRQAGARCVRGALRAARYTHNWGLFLLLGLACALPVAARARGAPPSARAMRRSRVSRWPLAYAPWVPTLLDQARHTGAPWSTTPGPGRAAERRHRPARRGRGGGSGDRGGGGRAARRSPARTRRAIVIVIALWRREARPGRPRRSSRAGPTAT